MMDSNETNKPKYLSEEKLKLLEKILEDNREPIKLTELFKDELDENGTLQIERLVLSNRCSNVDFVACHIEYFQCPIIVFSDLSKAIIDQLSTEVVIESVLPKNIDIQELEIKDVKTYIADNLKNARESNKHWEQYSSRYYNNDIDSGWKLHVYCDARDLEIAFNAIFAELLALRLDFKLLACDTNDVSDLDPSKYIKAVTIYLPYDESEKPVIKPEILNQYCKNISEKLTRANVRLCTPWPCDTQTIYQFLFIRNGVLNKNNEKNLYVSSKMAGSSFNPLNLFNPYEFLSPQDSNSKEFYILKHFSCFPKTTLLELKKSMYFVMMAALNQNLDKPLLEPFFDAYFDCNFCMNLIFKENSVKPYVEIIRSYIFSRIANIFKSNSFLYSKSGFQLEEFNFLMPFGDQQLKNLFFQFNNCVVEKIKNRQSYHEKVNFWKDSRLSFCAMLYVDILYSLQCDPLDEEVLKDKTTLEILRNFLLQMQNKSENPFLVFNITQFQDNSQESLSFEGQEIKIHWLFQKCLLLAFVNDQSNLFQSAREILKEDRWDSYSVSRNKCIAEIIKENQCESLLEQINILLKIEDRTTIESKKSQCVFM